MVRQSRIRPGSDGGSGDDRAQPRDAVGSSSTKCGPRCVLRDPQGPPSGRSLVRLLRRTHAMGRLAELVLGGPRDAVLASRIAPAPSSSVFSVTSVTSVSPTSCARRHHMRMRFSPAHGRVTTSRVRDDEPEAKRRDERSSTSFARINPCGAVRRRGMLDRSLRSRLVTEAGLSIDTPRIDALPRARIRCRHRSPSRTTMRGRSWRRSWTRTNCPAGLACHGLDATAGLPAAPTSLRPERAAVTPRTIWPSWCSAVQETPSSLCASPPLPLPPCSPCSP